MRRTLIFAVLSLVSGLSYADDRCLAEAARSSSAVKPIAGSIVLSTRSAKGETDTKVIAGEGGAQVTGQEGFRIASITKTFVAATVLRLWEDGRIDLDSPIAPLLPAEWVALLKKGGYAPEKITVRQLATHTSGLADHAQAPQFIAAVKAHPDKEWNRTIDLQKLIEWTKPVGQPGEKFSYSDTGYVLLGAIVERVTGTDLPWAARTELSLNTLNLPDTYWEKFEPANGRKRAHQMFEGLDTYNWTPTMDLFGGGGVVSTPQDLATFFDALLTGRLFKHPETLALMTSSQGLPAGDPYRIGVFVYDYSGARSIGHSGFWGTFVARETASGQTFAAAVTDRSDYPRLKEIMTDYLGRAQKSASGVSCEGDRQAESGSNAAAVGATP